MRGPALASALLFAASIGFVVGRATAPAPAPQALAPASADPFVVVRVIDGDTLVVRPASDGRGEEKVRLAAIDTPEVGQPAFREATQALTTLTLGKGILLEFDRPDRPERDRYGRLVAYVIADGVNVNIEMIRQGWSPYVTRYGKSRFAAEMLAAEESARASRLGRWAGD